MTIVGRAGKAMRQTHLRLDPHEIQVIRGDLCFSCLATIGQTQTDEVLADNTIITSRNRSYFIDVHSYDFGDGPTDPKTGDVIVDAGVRFVVAKDMSDSHFRWSDRERTYFRINTVEDSR